MTPGEGLSPTPEDDTGESGDDEGAEGRDGSETQDSQAGSPRLTRRQVAGVSGAAALTSTGAWVARPAPVSERPGWARMAALPGSRGEMKAATLDGRIYVPGGLRGLGGSAARMDVYEPGEGWERAASMPTGLNHHATATLDGQLYVVGGSERFDEPPGAFAFTYEPATDEWTALPDLPDGRWGHEAVTVDGRLHVVGGLTDSDDDIDTLVYDGDGWTRAAPIPTPREHVAATRLGDEVVVVSGRWDGNTDAVEAYDPSSDTWRSLPPVPTARSGFGAAVFEGGIHAVGGEDPSLVGGWTTATHERYEPGQGWFTVSDAPLPLHGHAVVGLGGRLHVLGGAWRQGLLSVTAWSDHAFVYATPGADS